MSRQSGIWTMLVLTALAGAALAQLPPSKDRPFITKKEFGKMPDGASIDVYTLTNAGGTTVKIMTLGGIITEWHVPDKDGKLDDVALGFDSLKGYLDGHPYFGCITGRVANRIAKGKFTLESMEYTLATNNGPNHLHGGKEGFDKKVWKKVDIRSGNTGGVGEVSLKLSYSSKDGEEGYPGNLQTTVTYSLNDKNELRIDYEATTDKTTIVNLTNHAYFNLRGTKGGDVLDHQLWLNADQMTPTDATLIPTGEIKDVKGTPFDFTVAKPIGRDIAKTGGDPSGYDLNYVIKDADAKKLTLCARATEPTTGRVMEVLTTEPGVQLYTGNFLDGTLKGKGGIVYKKHFGFCLETQHFPDAIHHANFPSIILKPGQKYSTSTVYRFSVKK